MIVYTIYHTRYMSAHIIDNSNYNIGDSLDQLYTCALHIEITMYIIYIKLTTCIILYIYILWVCMSVCMCMYMCGCGGVINRPFHVDIHSSAVYVNRPLYITVY